MDSLALPIERQFMVLTHDHAHICHLFDRNDDDDDDDDDGGGDDDRDGDDDGGKYGHFDATASAADDDGT